MSPVIQGVRGTAATHQSMNSDGKYIVKAGLIDKNRCYLEKISAIIFNFKLLLNPR
jgi:hypothetical protein